MNTPQGPAPQATPIPAPDRDAFLEQFAATYRFTLGQPRSITLTPKGEGVLFLRSAPRSFVQDLYAFDPATGRERVLLTADAILGGKDEVLTPEEKARRERMRMASRGIASFSLSKDGSTLLVPLAGKLFVVDRATGKSRELTGAEGAKAGFPIDPRLSPDASRLACVRDGDLYVTDVATGAERRLTARPGPNVTNATAEFVAAEEMDRHEGYWWSPDSKFIAYQQTDTSPVEAFHLAEPADPSKAPDAWPYPRPGKNNAKVRLGVIPAQGGDTVWVEWDREAFPYLCSVEWGEGGPLAVLVMNRRQTEAVLLRVDPATGKTAELLRERDDAWLNLNQSVPKWLKHKSAAGGGAGGFLWMSERSGEWQLELRKPDGSLDRALTPANFGLRSVLGVDDDRRLVYVAAGPEPTESHVYRVALDGPPAAPVKLTDAPGLHGATFSEDGSAFVRTSTPRETGVPSWTVFVPSKDAASVREAGQLRSVAEQPPRTPQVEWATVGERQFRTAIVRPRDFRGGAKYPVLVSVYAGPHSQTVVANPRRYLLEQWFADHGFVVAAIDGRGTPNRGRAWERAIRGDLSAVPLEDQVAALQALTRRYPEMDATRVGIYGWSFGGYFTLHAVARRPDIYRAGVAGAPVADWLDYDTFYTERYMGLPQENEAGYKASSALTYAKDLERPLLIVHGTSDDNVYFMHSLKMSEALFRAGKDFDFLPLSGFTHMVPDPVVTTRLYTRMADFFVKHLGANPPLP